MRSDHLSKHLKTHQAKKVNQQQQSEAEPAPPVNLTPSTPNDVAVDSETNDLAINENVGADGTQEMVITGHQI